jgi:hypothetical protein
MVTRVIEIYNDFGEAVGTARVRNCPPETAMNREEYEAAEELGYQCMLRWLKAHKSDDNPEYYSWDWCLEDTEEC